MLRKTRAKISKAMFAIARKVLDRLSDIEAIEGLPSAQKLSGGGESGWRWVSRPFTPSLWRFRGIPVFPLPSLFWCWHASWFS